MKRNIGAELAARMTHVNEMLANGESVEAVASEAEIDALEYVVEEGRIACHEDYGVLRSWLCRLRPAWKSTHSEEATLGEGTSQGGCTLTDEEREAVEYFATFHGSPREADAKHGKTLRSLLTKLRY